MPPTISIAQMKGFTLYATRTILSGRGDDDLVLVRVEPLAGDGDIVGAGRHVAHHHVARTDRADANAIQEHRHPGKALIGLVIAVDENPRHIRRERGQRGGDLLEGGRRCARAQRGEHHKH